MLGYAFGATGAMLVLALPLDNQPHAIERATRANQASAEVRSLENGALQRWRKPEVSVVIDASVHDVTPGAEQAVIQAFGAWLSANPNLPELSIEYGRGLKPKLDPDGINAVIYAPIEFSGHRDDLAITIGFSDEETGEITEADIIINSRHAYGTLETDAPGAPTTSCDGSSQASSCEHRYDLQNVMTHEVGHFYGLGENRHNRISTMYSCTSACETHKRDLSDDDQRGISLLYEQGSAQRQMGCSMASRAPGAPLGSWAGGFLTIALVSLLRRRRSGVCLAAGHARPPTTPRV